MTNTFHMTHMRCTRRESHGKGLHFRYENFVVEVDNVTTRLRSINCVPATYNFRLRCIASIASLIPIIGALNGLLIIALDVLDEDASVNVAVGLGLITVELHDISKCVSVLVRLLKSSFKIIC